MSKNTFERDSTDVLAYKERRAYTRCGDKLLLDFTFVLRRFQIRNDNTTRAKQWIAQGEKSVLGFFLCVTRTYQ